MLSRAELRKIARARLKDAEVLYNAKRHDDSVYVCGYAVEIALKARICRTLGWPGFPSNGQEFQKYSIYKTHDLDVLLHLSGIEIKIKAQYVIHWSDVGTWDPEMRYALIGSASQ